MLDLRFARNPVAISSALGAGQLLAGFWLSIAGSISGEPGGGQGPLPSPLLLILLLVGPILLGVAWSSVWAVCGAVAAVAAYSAIGYPGQPALPAALVALWVTIASGRRVEAWVVLVSGWAGWLGLAWLGGTPVSVGAAASALGWSVTWGLLAELRQSWIRALAAEHQLVSVGNDLLVAGELEQLLATVRAEALGLLEQAQDELARAGAGMRPWPQAPAQDLNPAIRESQALLNQAQRVLRLEPEEHPIPEIDLRNAVEAELTGPQLGAAALAQLAQRWFELGLTVNVDGAAGSLPADVDQLASRVIAEALSNVCQHSAANRAELQLSHEDSVLTVTISDAGPPRASGAREAFGEQGGGLTTLRARVMKQAGAITAGPTGPQGWRVRVALPTLDSRSGPAAAAYTGNLSAPRR